MNTDWNGAMDEAINERAAKHMLGDGFVMWPFTKVTGDAWTPMTSGTARGGVRLPCIKSPSTHPNGLPALSEPYDFVSDASDALYLAERVVRDVQGHMAITYIDEMWWVCVYQPGLNVAERLFDFDKQGSPSFARALTVACLTALDRAQSKVVGYGRSA